MGNSFKQIAKERQTSSGGGGGSAGLNSFAQIAGHRATGGTGVPAGTPPPAPKKKSSGGHGFLGTLKHVATQTPEDLYHAAVNSPGGAIQAGKAAVSDVEHLPHRLVENLLQKPGMKPWNGQSGTEAPKLLPKTAAEAAAYKQQLVEEAQHPLRHPGNTLLDLSGATDALIGGALRGAAAARAASEGGRVSDIVRAASKPVDHGHRTLRVGDLEVHPELSRGHIGALAQKASDTLLQKAADRNPAGRASSIVNHKVGKQLNAESKASERIARGPGQALIALGKKLKPGEQKALQVVAEQAPIEDRITAAAARVVGAKDKKARGRHQGELDLLHQAQQHLTTDGGKPALIEPRLQMIYDRMSTVAGDRETLLKSLGQLTDEAVQSRTTKAAGIAVGGHVVSPGEAARAATKVERAGHRLARSVIRSARVERRSALADFYRQRGLQGSAEYKAFRLATTRGASEKEMIAAERAMLRGLRRHGIASEADAGALAAAHDLLSKAQSSRESDVVAVRATAEQARASAEAALARANAARESGAARAQSVREGTSARAEQRRSTAGTVAGSNFTPSSNAVRIPDVATKTRGLKGGAVGGVGAQGTIGHLKTPGSLSHEYTGALREAGLTRNDTTTLVGESSVEAAKYAGLRHIHDLVRQAAAKTPTRTDDIAVRLDNLKGHERLPLDVRKFVDDPSEFFKSASEHQQASMVDKVREQLFIDPKKLDAQAKAEFAGLNEQGKIGWVPRKVLGDFAKPQAPLSAVVGSKPVRTVDAINNASRFAILYLKPAYAIPNLLGNGALTLLQQGFAAVPNLKRAAMLNSKLGADVAARVDAAMGEGFALSVSAHGQGRLAGAVDKAAQIWSKGVDTPFRRSSFLYEARRAGYSTPSQITRLVTDQALHGELGKISIRANREIIDYSNLSPLEREVVRRVVFFLPWVKGSTVYAGRLLREHPVKAAVLGHLGERGKQVSDQTLGPVPSYLEGIVPWAGGSEVVNPNSAAILQTPAVLGASLAGLATGNIPEVAQATNYYTPALALAAAELTRTNPQTGQAYKPGTNGLSIAQQSLTGGLPQVTLAHNLKAAITGQGGSRLYPPSVKSALLQFLVGGVAPRKIDRQDLARLAALEQRQMRTGR